MLLRLEYGMLGISHLSLRASATILRQLTMSHTSSYSCILCLLNKIVTFFKVNIVHNMITEVRHLISVLQLPMVLWGQRDMEKKTRWQKGAH